MIAIINNVGIKVIKYFHRDNNFLIVEPVVH